VVTAAMNVNTWDVVEHHRAIIESGRALDLAKLIDPEVALADLARG
jgi:3-phenylpropionate/trans-cinnamate dioxygenase ferredoxin reductase subunit